MIRFPLATVLRVRRIREDMAKADAAAAAASLRHAVTDHARRQAVLDGRPVPGTAAAAHWLAIRATTLALAADVAATQAMIDERSRRADEAREVLGRASREREGLEDLAQRHATRVRAGQEATEARAADDRAGARHRRPRTADELDDPTGERLPIDSAEGPP
ncbi:MAG: hypothetical protein ACT4P1_17215 [Sporichthyaceae bacterium]